MKKKYLILCTALLSSVSYASDKVSMSDLVSEEALGFCGSFAKQLLVVMEKDSKKSFEINDGDSKETVKWKVYKNNLETTIAYESLRQCLVIVRMEQDMAKLEKLSK